MDVEFRNTGKIAQICRVKECGVRQFGWRNTVTLHGRSIVQCRQKTAFLTYQNELDDTQTLTIQTKLELVSFEHRRESTFKSPEKPLRLKTRATTKPAPTFKT